MYLNFDKFALEKPNECGINYIEVYERYLNEEDRKNQFCGTTAEPQKSDGNIMIIRLHSKSKNFKTKFMIAYTAFRVKEDKGNHWF